MDNKSSNKQGIILVIFILLVGIGVIVYNRIDVDGKIRNEKKKEKIVINNDTNYNLRLIKEVNKNENKNYLISPYSIKVALNMLAEGANNETREEILNLVGDSSNKITPIKNRINDANAIFIKNKYEEYIEKEFINNIKQDYNGDVLLDEFKNPSVINNWVKKQTYDMIPNLLDDIDEEFVLGLANAIAIDVEWDSKFDCYSTKKKEFNKIDKTTMNVSMMSNSYEDNAQYILNNKYKGVILPYAPYNKKGEIDYDVNEHLEFVGIIPNSDVNSFVNNLDDNFLKNIDKETKKVSSKVKLLLSIPSFSYDYSLEGFKDVLKNLGVKKAFSSEEADFSKIITDEIRKKNSIDNIYVDQAIHKTHIELNESGTKAAAVTFFGVETMGYDPNKEEPKIVEIKFDKPFFYLIRDSINKEILFFGVVYEPDAYKERKCD